MKHPQFSVALLSMLLLLGTALPHKALAKAPPPQVEVIRFADFEKMLGQGDYPVQVINFWATWCKPCIAEMPHFIELQEKYGKKLNIIFLSLDDSQELTRVQDFVNKKNIQSDVYLLDEIPNQAFINKVDSRWQGGIPFTLVVKNGKTVAIEEGSFHSFADLTQLIVPFLRN